MPNRNIIDVGKNRLLVSVVLFLSFFLFAKVSFAAYYIDQTNGNDSYDGLAPSFVSGTNGHFLLQSLG